MSFLAQVKLTEDSFLIDRIAACAATHGVTGNARVWAATRIWELSTSPGWAESYHEALQKEPPVDPAAWSGIAGADPNVISDEMINEAVSGIIDKERKLLFIEPQVY